MAKDRLQSGEDRLIARYFRPIATHPGAFGLSDDAAAIVPPPGCDLVLKTDAIIGGVHFFPDDPADAVAKKALRVNLSDLAAKGAEPLGFLLAIGLPSPVGDKWLRAFARGLKADADAYKCPLFGGDTVRAPAVMVSVAVFGAVPRGKMLKRSGARVGDRIVVTGTIGDAALGLRLRQSVKAAARWRLSAPQRAHLESRYLVPQPRNAIAGILRRYANGAMDVSDGLAGDLTKLCRASKVSARIDAARVPLSAAAARALAAEPALLEPILTGGDDFEVIAAVAPVKVDALRRAAAKAGVAVTDIGEVTAGRAAPRFLHGGRAMQFKRRSYSHF